MRETDSLARNFWVAIALGFATFLLISGLLAYSASNNPSQGSHQTQNQQNASSAPSNGVAIPPAQTPSAAQTAGDSASKNREKPMLFEVKITDLALILFTYCLVVVGWATMRSGELNAERNERAYIFVGGGTGINVMLDQYGCLHNFMWCKNSGRSFATLTEYYFGWSDKEPTGKPEYPSAREGLNVFTDKIDLVCNPGEPQQLNAAAVNINVRPSVLTPRSKARRIQPKSPCVGLCAAGGHCLTSPNTNQQ